MTITASLESERETILVEPGSSRPASGTPLAAFAHIRRPPARDELAHRRAAPRARLAAAAMDQELVLEGAALPVGVAEVVDRRAARGEAGFERRDHRVAQRRHLAGAQRAGRPQRVDPRAEQ